MPYLFEAQDSAPDVLQLLFERITWQHDLLDTGALCRRMN